MRCSSTGQMNTHVSAMGRTFILRWPISANSPESRLFCSDPRPKTDGFRTCSADAYAGTCSGLKIDCRGCDFRIVAAGQDDRPVEQVTEERGIVGCIQY